MHSSLSHFANIWIVVAAVRAQPGERTEPRTIVAMNFDTKHVIENSHRNGFVEHPYTLGADCLLVTTNGPELVGCHLALGWPVPARLLDLLVEFKNISNGRSGRLVGGLAGALIWFGENATGTQRHGEAPDQIRTEVNAVARLFNAMLPSLDLGRALLRGRFISASAAIDATGVPVDQQILSQLKHNWPRIRDTIVDGIDAQYGVHINRLFRADLFKNWINRRGISWPLSPDGGLDLGDNAFREMARAYPEVQPLKELRATLKHFDPRNITVGLDGRNRSPLRPFASRTSRNQPSANASIFCTAAWVRNLVRPSVGYGLALIDWQQQEFGIAAALSGDLTMQNAYQSGDPYMALAIAAGAAPPGATRSTHSHERELFKLCALGVQYGMGSGRLAQMLDMPISSAKELLNQHQSRFRTFWSWLDGVESQAASSGVLHSVFGWRMSSESAKSARGLRNFPMQANGAEMLRLACCQSVERGVTICTVIHDALLIEAPLAHLDQAIETTERMMEEASETVLAGFPLRTEVRIIKAPNRWAEIRGESVWSAVERVLRDNSGIDGPAHQRDETCSTAHSRSISLSPHKEAPQGGN